MPGNGRNAHLEEREPERRVIITASSGSKWGHCGLPLHGLEGKNTIKPPVSITLSPISLLSTAAKDLVRHLLVVDPKKRYTAHQVLQHPWIEMAGHSTVNPQKGESPSSEGRFQSQHRKVAGQVP
ncbi:Serine/threonine-protein kinase DCLK3 [Microtus ochrogaster]|uniref:Serine/threonine-protein kinase DCLK3 n=1 Tax=Microtus ochrogaster TaxID=79684 RepID=A0A8J6FXV1_MICOH|nr:Serine/threonine-protein kinase DCLK3 [Microtus ochrogaster]